MPRRAWFFQVLLLAGFVAAACLYLSFLELWGHDSWFHLQRLQDVAQQCSRGQFRMYFAENAAQGKGLPVWIYYSQWVYWPAVLPRSLGVSPLTSLKLVYCAFLVVCCAGCYRLLRLEADETTAAFGTLLFVTSNYVIGEIFQRAAYAEFLSVALLPLLLVALRRTLDGDARSATALTVLVSLMILFHPLSFMNAACAVVAYAAHTAVKRGIPYRRLLELVPPLALALALTAFYWLPTVVETRYVLGAEGVPTPLRDTFLSAWSYINFSGVTNLGFVLSSLAVVVAGGLLLARRRPDAARSWSSWPLVAGIVVYVLLTLPISEPLYSALPLLAANLWVWRVLFPLILLVVIFLTANLSTLPPRLRSDTALRAMAVVAVLQAAAFVLWNSAEELSVRRIDAAEIEREVAVESRRTAGFGIDEYLPHPRVAPRPGVPCRTTRTVTPEGRYEMSFVIAPHEADSCFHVRRYWNTRYAASIDGEATPEYADVTGDIIIVSGGRAGVVTLRFTRPAYVTFSVVLSGVAAMLLLIVVAVRELRKPAGWRARR
jgi:uncharacterized membrane protein